MKIFKKDEYEKTLEDVLIYGSSYHYTDKQVSVTATQFRNQFEKWYFQKDVQIMSVVFQISEALNYLLLGNRTLKFDDYKASTDLLLKSGLDWEILDEKLHEILLKHLIQ